MHDTMRTIHLVPLLLVGLACSGPVPDTIDDRGSSSVRDSVLAEIERYYDALSARDWDRFADHFWAGATITTVWQPPGETAPRVVASTIPEFVRRAPEGPDSREIFEERMTGARTRINGNLAQVWATYHARFGDPGAIMEWDGIDAFTLIRHNGRWRIVSLAFAAE